MLPKSCYKFCEILQDNQTVRCLLDLSENDKRALSSSPGCPDEHCPEWVIIDLQGNLETRQSVPLNGRFIGDLHFTNTDIPLLIIGHHILYGKVVDLEKPFAVLSKTRTESHDPEVAMETEDDHSQSDLSGTSYTVKAIIKKKLLFKTRPKPIIAHVPKTI